MWWLCEFERHKSSKPRSQTHLCQWNKPFLSQSQRMLTSQPPPKTFLFLFLSAIQFKNRLNSIGHSFIVKIDSHRYLINRRRLLKERSSRRQADARQFKTDRSRDARSERALMSIAELNTERKTGIETKGKGHAKQHRNVKSSDARLW